MVFVGTIEDLRGWVDRRHADRRFLVKDVFVAAYNDGINPSSYGCPSLNRVFRRRLKLVLVRPPCGLAPNDCKLNEAPARKSPIIRDPLRLH